MVIAAVGNNPCPTAFGSFLAAPGDVGGDLAAHV